MSVLERPTHVDTLPEQILPNQLEAVSRLEARLVRREVEDDEGFLRTEFTIPGHDEVTVVFRGREELPTMPVEEGTMSAVLTADERPLHTSGDDFGVWMTEVNQGADPYGDPFERAVEVGAEKVRLVATSTPYGLVSAAISLAETGVAHTDPVIIDQLKALKQQLKDRDFSDDVLEFFDKIYAATAIHTIDGELQEVADRTGMRPNEQGLMEVVMALSGDEDATQVIEAKQQVVQARDYDRSSSQRSSHRLKEGVDLKEPGEQLSEAELELVASKHLVGVHTTEVRPFFVAGGDSGVSVLRSTVEFGDDRERFPRSTMHWSLNHPVTSHILGNFSDRPFTVVAPVEDLMQGNGTPAVLYGVDTYFTLNPGDGMVVPPSAVVIETIDQPDAPWVEKSGNYLRLKRDGVTSKDIQAGLSVLREEFFDEKDMTDEQVLSVLVDGMALEGPFSTAVSEVKQGIWENESDRFSPARLEVIQRTKEFRALLDETSPSGPFAELEGEESKRVFKETLHRLLTEEGLIEQYPGAQPMLAESMRQQLVRLQISKLGGRNVHSDGMSAYITDDAFNAAVHEVSSSLGIREGLHIYQPEAAFEQAYGTAMHGRGGSGIEGAVETLTVASDEEEGGLPKEVAANYDWVKYSKHAGKLLAALSTSPVPTRRMAISMGLITHARQKPEPVTEMSGL